MADKKKPDMTTQSGVGCDVTKPLIADEQDSTVQLAIPNDYKTQLYTTREGNGFTNSYVRGDESLEGLSSRTNADSALMTIGKMLRNLISSEQTSAAQAKENHAATLKDLGVICTNPHVVITHADAKALAKASPKMIADKGRD